MFTFSSDFRYISKGFTIFKKTASSIWPLEEDDSLNSRNIQLVGPRSAFYYVRCEKPSILRLSTNNDNYKPKYIKETLWGNVFFQGYKIGYASYHFISRDNVYISYENPSCAKWPSLDDGSDVPKQVPFRSIQWDEGTHTFRGTIEWLALYGSTWMDSATWQYEIKFDKDFIGIVSGTVHSISSSGTNEEMSRYGDILNYANAALSPTLFPPSFICEVFNRLSQEGATQRTIDYIQEMLEVDSDSFVDYNDI